MDCCFHWKCVVFMHSLLLFQCSINVCFLSALSLSFLCTLSPPLSASLFSLFLMYSLRPCACAVHQPFYHVNMLQRDVIPFSFYVHLVSTKNVSFSQISEPKHLFRIWANQNWIISRLSFGFSLFPRRIEMMMDMPFKINGVWFKSLINLYFFWNKG